MVQQPQKYNDYCGPATASEVLGMRGTNVSQDTLAGNSYLQTNQDGGTNWSPQVMQPTLNTLLPTYCSDLLLLVEAAVRVGARQQH